MGACMMVEISGFRWPSTVLQIQIVAAVVAVVTVDEAEADHVTVVAVAAEVAAPGPGRATATVADRGHVPSVAAVDAIDPSPGQTLGPPDHRSAAVENAGQSRSRTIDRKSSRSLDPDLQSRDRDQNHDPGKKKVETSRLD